MASLKTLDIQVMHIYVFWLNVLRLFLSEEIENVVY